MTFLNFREEFLSIQKRIRIISNTFDMRALSDIPFPEKDDVQANMELIAATTTKTEEMLATKSTLPLLEEPKRSALFTETIAKMGRELRGGIAIALDVFKERFLQAVDQEWREAWAGESVQMMVTMILEQPEIAELLEQEGILLWVGDDFEVDMHTGDNKIRIVNARWLEKNIDIYEFVVAEPLASKRCRFCTALEEPSSFALQPLDPALRNKDAMIAGMTGEQVQILAPGIVYTHPKCGRYWRNFVRIAEQFSEEEATA